MYQCNNRTSGETDVLETEPDIKQHENTCNDQCLDRIGTHLITDGRTNTLALDCGFINTKACPPASDLLLHVRSALSVLCLNCGQHSYQIRYCMYGVLTDNLCDFLVQSVFLYLLETV